MLRLIADIIMNMAATAMLGYVIYCGEQARWMKNRLSAMDDRWIRDFDEDYLSWVQVARKGATAGFIACILIIAGQLIFYTGIMGDSFYGHRSTKIQLCIMSFCALIAFVMTAMELLRVGRPAGEDAVMNCVYHYVQRFGFNIQENQICLMLLCGLLDVTPAGMIKKYKTWALNGEEQAGRMIVTDLVETCLQHLDGGDTYQLVLDNGKKRTLHFDDRSIRYLQKMQQGAKW